MRRATNRATATGLILLAWCGSGISAASIDSQAERALREMTDYAQTLKSFRAELQANFNLQTGGTSSKINFVYAVAGERPNRLATVVRTGAGAPLVVSDGKQLFAFVPMLGKYVLADAPPSFKDLVAAEPVQGTSVGHSIFAGALLPLASYDELAGTLESAQYLGEEKVGAAKCHHLKLSQASYDWDLWIDIGKKPLPRKLEPDMSKWQKANSSQLPADAKVEVVLNFKSWVINPVLKDKDFKIEPPASARQVASFAPQPGQKEDGPELLKGTAAPPFSLAMLGGGSVNLADHKNKEIVILDFWATWCGPCVAALPQVAEVAEAYRAKGVAFYAVNQREDAETILQFLRDKQLRIPVAMDAQSTAAGLYRVSGIPQTVIIGRTGNVEVVHVGFSPNLKQSLAAELDALIASQPAPAATTKTARTKK